MEDVPQVKSLLEVMARRYRVMLLAVAVALAGGVLLARSRPKLYRASARVLIEPRRPGFPSTDKDYGLAMYYVFYRNELQTQLLFIKSRPVAERVAEKLGLPGKSHPRRVTSTEEPDATRHGDTEALRKGGRMKAEGGRPIHPSSFIPHPSGASVPPCLRGEGASPDPAGALLGLYVAEPVGETRFIDISAKTTDPEWAARIANAAAEAYIAETLDRRRRMLRETMAAFTLMSPDQHEKLQQAERDLIRFQQKHLVVSSDKPEDTLSKQELDLVEQLASARRERIGTQARLMAHSAEGVISPDKGRMDPALANAMAADDGRTRQLLDSRLRQRAHITELSKSFSDGHPKLESAKTTLAEIESELAAAARSYYGRMQLAYQAAVWKEKEIARLLAEHRKRIVSLRTWLTQMENLRQRRDSLRALLGPVARSQAELGLLANLDLPNASVVDRASPPAGPSEPSLPKYVLGALLAGLVLGAGLVVVLESVDDSVRTPDDVAKAAPVKVLGTVSFIKRQLARDERGRALVTADRSESVVAEQFRSLRTGILEFAQEGRNAGPREGAAGEPNASCTVALVTSPDLADGKTTVSFNAAEAFAQLGRPVIIVDADLRRPKGHEFLGVPRSPGLVEVLEGEAELEDAVRRTPVADLLFLPAGRKTSRPAELIASERLGEVLSQLRRTYSSVWLDTAPVMPVTDARVLASAADFTILVVRSARTRRRALARSYELLVGAGGERPRRVTFLNEPDATRGDGRLVGAVLNGVVPSVERQYGYYGRAYDRYYGGKEA